MAEEYGFDHAWTYDHLGWRSLVDKPWFDAVPTLTAAATVTSKIRLGTLVASPNFRHPAHFARELTALDDISDGRFSVGLGSGGAGFDATVLGAAELTSGQRVDRYTEFVELLHQILTEDVTTYRGEYFEAVEARRSPGCVQQPRVPFVMAANGPRSMRLAARYGTGWVTTGRGEDDLEAWWRGITATARTFDETLEGVGRKRPMARYLQADAAPMYSLSSAEYYKEVVGRAKELGFTDVITHWPRPDGPYEGKESVLEEIASDVLPSLRS